MKTRAEYPISAIALPPVKNSQRWRLLDITTGYDEDWIC